MGKISYFVFLGFFLVLFSAILIVFPTTVNAQSTTITVCPTGTPHQNGCDFIGGDGIQEAIDSSSSTTTTTIRIKSGTYTRQAYSEFTIEPPGFTETDKLLRKCFLRIQEKPVSLVGEPGVILDGFQSQPMNTICIKQAKADIQQLTIRGVRRDANSVCTQGPCSRGYGFYIDKDSDIHISTVTIEESQNRGILVTSNAKATMRGMTIRKSYLEEIYINDSSEVSVENSTFDQSRFLAIRVTDRAKALIRSNHFTYPEGITESPMSILQDKSSQTTIDNNIFQNSPLALYCVGSSQSVLTGNQFINNKQALSVGEQSALTIKNNVFANYRFPNKEGKPVSAMLIFASDYPMKLSIINNTIIGGYGGIDFQRLPPENIELVNNIFAFNYFTGVVHYGTGLFKRVAYNLFWANGFSDSEKANWLQSYEIPYPNNSIVNPEFMYPDFHVKPVSPARNTGDPAILNPDGSRSDIGAYGGPGACDLDSSLPGCNGSQPTTTPPNQPPSNGLKGDIDHNGKVDIFDYNIMITNFGQTNCGNPADIDGNCKVDIFDYNILITNFGR